MAAFPRNRGNIVLALALWCVSAWALLASAQVNAPGPAMTEAEGYRVTRSQTIEPALPDSVGRITVDTEESVGNTDATRGNSRKLELRVGAIVKKCPTADGLVMGRFEYALIVHQDIAVAGERQQAYYWQQLNADLVGHVKDDGMLDYVEFKGSFSRIDNGTHTPAVNYTIPHQTTFRPSVLGGLDHSAALRTVEKTGELAFAMAMSLASPVFTPQAQTQWMKPGECVEVSFDPESETVALGPSETKDVRVTLKTKGETSAPVMDARMDANVLNSAGSVSPGSVPRAEDSATFTYSASSQPRRGQGFGIAALSRAGAAKGEWKIGDGDVKLTIEHRRWDNPTSPRSLGGWTQFDGTVRFDITLRPSGFENNYRSSTSIVRNMTIGHVKNCRGTARQTEEWDVRATIDPEAKTIRVEPRVYEEGDGEGNWGGCAPVTIFPKSDPTPVELPAVIGRPQTFQIVRRDGNFETLTVTILASPVTQ
jgi:hypothetical protein